jgi:hypothetical protein
LMAGKGLRCPLVPTMPAWCRAFRGYSAGGSCPGGLGRLGLPREVCRHPRLPSGVDYQVDPCLLVREACCVTDGPRTAVLKNGPIGS